MLSTPISEIYARTDLQRVIGFILCGAEDSDVSKESYDTRLTKATRPMVKRLEGIYPDADDMDNAYCDFSQALAAFQNVYTEIGMKVGARLVCQLLCIDDNAPPPTRKGDK